jgi:hypothetical protein
MTTLSLAQTPDALNIKLRQYQEWALAFTFCQTDQDGNYDLSNPIDLTGFTPTLQLRTSAMAKVAALTATVANGGLVFEPTTVPQVQVSVGVNVAPGKYEWDLRVSPPNDPYDSIFLGRGTVQVDAEVSR